MNEICDGRNERLWNRGFIAITLCGFLLFLNLQMLLSALPAYLQQRFGAGDISIGLVTSLFALSSIFARIFAAQSFRRWRAERLLYIGLIAAMITTAGAYWCPVLVGIMALRMIYGFGFGAASTILPTMASRLIPDRRMGEGMGYFGFSNTLGLSLGPMTGMFLLMNYGFGALTFFSILALALIFPIYAWFAAQSAVPSAEKPAAGGRTAVTARKFFSRKLILPTVLNFLLSVTYSGLIGFIALFGIEKNIPNAGTFFFVQSAVVLAIRPFAGRYFDRRGPAAVLFLGALLITAGLLLLSFSDTLPQLLGSAFVYGCGYGLIQPSIQAWMILEAGQEERGMANGMFYNSIDLGVMVGTAVLGIVAWGTDYTSMYRWSVLCMVLFLLLLILYVRKPSLRRGE